MIVQAVSEDLFGYSYVSISWVYRGQYQENSTLLQFNVFDTLNLACVADSGEYNDTLAIAITKGNTPPDLYLFDDSKDYGFISFYVLDAEEIVYDDVYGIYENFENFMIFRHQSQLTQLASKEFRYITIQQLYPSDSGEYYCSAQSLEEVRRDGTYVAGVYHSGSVVISVDSLGLVTGSPLRKASQVMTYSALLLSASKILF